MIPSLAVNVIRSTVLPYKKEENLVAEGRSYRHWSEKVAFGSAAFGTACAIVGFVLKNTIFGVFGVFLTFTNGIAAFFLHKFLPLKALEGHVQDLTGQVDKVDHQLEDLKTANKQLQHFKDQFGPLMEEAQKAQAIMERRLEDKTAAWEKTVNDFQESEKRLEGVGEVLVKVQSVNKALNAQITTQEAETKSFLDKIEKLNEQLFQLQEMEKNYAVEKERLSSANIAMAEQSEHLHKRLSSLEEETKVLQATIEKLTQERIALEKQVAALQVSLEAANQSANKAAQEAASYAEAAKALEEAGKQIQQKTDHLKNDLKSQNIDDLVSEIISS